MQKKKKRDGWKLTHFDIYMFYSPLSAETILLLLFRMEAGEQLVPQSHLETANYNNRQIHFQVPVGQFSVKVLLKDTSALEMRTFLLLID